MGDMDVFGDQVHGFIQLPQVALQLSRTRQVQRLKRLKQLGLTCLIPRYSFATHTRWQHSLGVAHLAGVVGSSIAASQPHLDLRTEDVEDLQLAGGWDNACL
jgi:HD superfamily phosphohydrolase